MATRTAYVARPPGSVFDVLRDGYSYGDWVVGTQRIRAVDGTWPAVGSRIHYSVGVRRLTFDDVTTVLSVEPDRRLELEVRGWPAGTVRVLVELAPEGGGTRVRMEEHPLRGPARALHNPLSDLAISLRNVETLRRLRRLVESRSAG